MAFDLPTNFSNGTAVTGVGGIFEYASYATGDWFGTIIVAIIFMMAFGISAAANIGRAFASGSFVALVFSVYFARIGAVSPTIPFILATMTIIGFFWAKGERSASY